MAKVKKTNKKRRRRSTAAERLRKQRVLAQRRVLNRELSDHYIAAEIGEDIYTSVAVGLISEGHYVPSDVAVVSYLAARQYMSFVNQTELRIRRWVSPASLFDTIH